MADSPKDVIAAESDVADNRLHVEIRDWPIKLAAERLETMSRQLREELDRLQGAARRKPLANFMDMESATAGHAAWLKAIHAAAESADQLDLERMTQAKRALPWGSADEYIAAAVTFLLGLGLGVLLAL